MRVGTSVVGHLDRGEESGGRLAPDADVRRAAKAAASDRRRASGSHRQMAAAAPKVKNLAEESADLTATVAGSANGPLRPGVLGV